MSPVMTHSGILSRSDRVDEAEQTQVRKQHPPVRPEADQYPRPVEMLRVGQDQMHDVRGVVALALHDERLGPDRLLHRAQQNVDSKHLPRAGVFEPSVIYIRNAIARVEDHIHVTMLAGCLAQPVRERQLGVKPRLLPKPS